ncbi:MAG: UDP-N-acetylmuramoyl-tripeptide--D-alanyl-D-alanine ligase, partial [Clostridia bacterium]|nr:UDP-N-acetylmuramoyl-tripeptide--D-alanyl-D-alanine ligase [Clostridia bacterium]
KLLEAADGITDREIVLYGIDNPDVDCRASDIREGEDSITFTLTWRGESHEIFIPTIGRHNVYNACAAFVCGQLAGVSPREAIDGLRAYCPDARRQKIVRKKGITFIEDCYNASPDSIRASVGVLASIPCTGRRIAVLGDMLELGDYAKQAHSDCGKVVRELGVDILLAYGNNAKYYIEGAGDGIEGRLYDDKAALADDLLVTLREGDAVLFKASRGMKLEDVFERLYKEME